MDDGRKRVILIAAAILASHTFAFSELVRAQVAKFVISDVAAKWSNAAVISL